MPARWCCCGLRLQRRPRRSQARTITLRAIDQTCLGLPAPASVTDQLGAEALGAYLQMLGAFGELRSTNLEPCTAAICSPSTAASSANMTARYAGAPPQGGGGRHPPPQAVAGVDVDGFFGRRARRHSHHECGLSKTHQPSHSVRCSCHSAVMLSSRLLFALAGAVALASTALAARTREAGPSSGAAGCGRGAIRFP